ncbi:hypothetical protein ACGFX4_38760 [Kitasatospora sp. NPDC048365]|uniref:hypothetical protein n=1 Tax=Kitasatospora sp. NPDC048365 TaxID=3364050 RepID=UPI00371F6364
MGDHITQEQLDAVLDSHPVLTAEGYGSGLAPDPGAARKSLSTDIEGVRRAARWIEDQPWTAEVDPRSPSSYGAKHAMEAAGHGYVTNGAFVAACLLLGVPAELDDLNPSVAIRV